jgi:hypothetical protein
MFKKYYLFCFLFLLGCSEYQDKDPLICFKSEPVQLVATIIPTDKPVLLGGTVALIEDTLLAIQTYQEDTLLTFINVLNGKTVKRMVSRGRGPGEMLMLKFCSQTNKNQLWIFDPNQPGVHFIDNQVIMTDALYKPVAKLRSLDLFKIDTCFVASGFSVYNHRFRIFDSKGNTVDTCLHYQKPGIYQKIPDHIYSTGYQGWYTVHPDNNKFVFAAFFGCRFQIFDFVNNTIQPKVDLFFWDPVLREENRVCILDRQSKMGFQNIDSNQQFIYALYSGKTKADHLDELTCSHLLVFDWDGNPVKRYLLDTPLSSFCMNEAGTKLYGVAFTPETTIVQYDLNP